MIRCEADATHFAKQAGVPVSDVFSRGQRKVYHARRIFIGLFFYLDARRCLTQKLTWAPRPVRAVGLDHKSVSHVQ